MVEKKNQGVGNALLAAVLFGASAPITKLLLPRVEPMLMAGLLYLGSGIGLAAYWVVNSKFAPARSREAKLSKKDLPWLAGAIVSGGLVAPFLLMLGLSTTSASSASLFLSFEGVITALLAWFVFKENVDRRIALGMALISGGGICLAWIGRTDVGLPLGLLAILGACFGWAVDNNLTRKVSGADPVQIAMLKCLIAGSMNVLLALAAGARLPDGATVLMAGAVGLFSYGISLVLFVTALRHIGTARTGAYFSTAPFIGAAISIAFFGDNFTAGFCLAAVMMGAGVWLHITEQHKHGHRHAALEHDHLHSHDAHHRHAHGSAVSETEPHAHPHRHEPLEHIHTHYPDLHHNHSHG